MKRFPYSKKEIITWYTLEQKKPKPEEGYILANIRVLNEGSFMEEISEAVLPLMVLYKDNKKGTIYFHEIDGQYGSEISEEDILMWAKMPECKAW